MRLIFCIFVFVPLQLFGQFDPAGGEVGSQAIHRDNVSISYWPDSVQLDLGYQRINADNPLFVSTGEESDAVGKADNRTVSLGDGGQATYYFERSISNISGPDFVVFENGFEWIGGYFLELAFVEVSSDGKTYVRFPAESAADTLNQIENLAYMECNWYNNLAGKHQAPYGTPFDLEQLKDSAGLDVTNISHIRVVDVVGSLNDSFTSRDIHGNKINDPWPTDFESGGFDIDAIGVLQFSLSTDEKGVIKRFVTPNPSSSLLGFDINISYKKLSVLAMDGSIVYQDSRNTKHHNPDLAAGIFTVQFETEFGILNQRICVTQ